MEKAQTTAFKTANSPKKSDIKEKVSEEEYEVKEDTPVSVYDNTESIHKKKVWIPNADGVDRLWEIAEVIASNKETVTVVKDSIAGEKEVATYLLHEIYRFDESHTRDWRDVAKINDLHEPALLDLLGRRYKDDKIYTFSDDILISINPYKSIPGLYGDIVSTSGNFQKGTPIPHLFTVAENARKAIIANKQSQSILVNGESGAGKTEATKHIMKYLMHKSNNCNTDIDTDIHKSILGSNNVLEAFGNAKTIRNSNSSRFGKFVKLLYSNGVIHGAKTQHFLLEKSRIVQHGESERNYHIFYQLCSSPEKRKEFELEGANAYRILASGNDQTMHNISEEENMCYNMAFEETCNSMEAVKIFEEQRQQIWAILVALLQLGNIEFEHCNVGTAEGSQVKESSYKFLLRGSKLLDLSKEKLESTLCMREIQTGRRSCYTIPLTPKEASDSRDALVKTLYSSLFNWLVQKINFGTLYDENQSDGYIGILDIFGFEVLEQNSFEQLCVNYANEVLQNLFNHHVLAVEKKRYEIEGIDWTCISFQDNQKLIEVLDGPRIGIFTLLNEEGQLGQRGSDESFLTRVNAAHKNCPNYSADRFNRMFFVIHHFASSVEYKVSGFLSKNNDSLQSNLIRVVAESTNEFLNDVLKSSENEMGSNLQNQNKIAALNSVSTRFRKQMSNLLNILKLTGVHFVRCVKPNNAQVPNKWNENVVLKQLQHLGILECVRIRQEGFPVIKAWTDIVNEYSTILPDDFCNEGKNEREMCEAILHCVFGEDSEGSLWQLGNQEMVFISEPVLSGLNEALHSVQVQKAEAAQREIQKQLEIEQEKKTNELKQLEQLRLEMELRVIEEAKLKEEEEKERLRIEQEEKAAEEERLRIEKEQERIRLEMLEQHRREASKRFTEEQMEHKNRSATKIQCCWRMHRILMRFNKLLAARKVWSQFLKPNEAIVRSSLVIHTLEFSFMKNAVKGKGGKIIEKLMSIKRRRELILTTLGRLLLVDPQKMVVKFEVVLTSVEIKALIINDKDFVIQGNETFANIWQQLDDVELGYHDSLASLANDPKAGKDPVIEWKLHDILGSAAPWVTAIRRPYSVFELLTLKFDHRFDTTEAVLKQGYLRKRAIKSGKNWRERYFVLQGSKFMWFKSQKQSKPTGTVTMCGKTIILFTVKDEMANVRHGLVIKTPSVAVYISCKSVCEQCQWAAALSEAIAVQKILEG